MKTELTPRQVMSLLESMLHGETTGVDEIGEGIWREFAPRLRAQLEALLGRDRVPEWTRVWRVVMGKQPQVLERGEFESAEDTQALADIFLQIGATLAKAAEQRLAIPEAK